MRKACCTGTPSLVQIVDATFADAARAQRSTPGLSAGLHAVPATALLLSTHWMLLRLRHAMSELSASDPALAAQIRERARRYLAEFGSSFPGDPVSGILGFPVMRPRKEAFAEFANEAACPALNPETEAL